MTNAKFVMGVMIFNFVFAAIVASMTGGISNLINPLTLALLQIPIVAVVAASNTPIAKGVAMAVFFGALIVYVLQSPSVPVIIYSVIEVPMFIGLGVALAEVGRG